MIYTSAMTKSKTDNRKPPTKHKSCGTVSGMAAHVRAGEQTCAACRKAKRDYQNEYRRKKRAAANGVKPKTAPAKPAPAVANTPAPAPDNKAPAPADTAAPVATQPPSTTPGVPLPPPAYLKKEGLKLWNAITSTYRLSPGAVVLAVEACRLTDRLERYAAALSSSNVLWFELEESVDENGLDDGRNWTVSVNGLLGEARQSQAALRTTLKQMGLADVELFADDEDEAPAPSALDQLAQRRKERLEGAV